MSDQLFVPIDFAVPDRLKAGEFRLEPLGPQYSAADYAAWTASFDHIRATPGFPWGSWPHPMSLADNLRDLQRYAEDFAERREFTYTVLGAGAGDVKVPPGVAGVTRRWRPTARARRGSSRLARHAPRAEIMPSSPRPHCPARGHRARRPLARCPLTWLGVYWMDGAPRLLVVGLQCVECA